MNRFQDATIVQLAREIQQGHKVIVGLDAGELWNQHPILEEIEDFLGLEEADHAVVVSGIDTANPSDIRVIISDPGTGQAIASYPIDQFLDAWEDSDFFMVATQDPAPAHLPEMLNFQLVSDALAAIVNRLEAIFLGSGPDAGGLADVLHDLNNPLEALMSSHGSAAAFLASASPGTEHVSADDAGHGEGHDHHLGSHDAILGHDHMNDHGLNDSLADHDHNDIADDSHLS